MMQTAKQRMTNLSVIVSVTGTLSGKRQEDKTGLGAKMTERRHVPGDSNLSRPKTNWDMAKEKETQINTEIKKRKENYTE